jgi:hypothetical protein
MREGNRIQVREHRVKGEVNINLALEMSLRTQEALVSEWVPPLLDNVRSARWIAIHSKDALFERIISIYFIDRSICAPVSKIKLIMSGSSTKAFGALPGWSHFGERGLNARVIFDVLF